MEGGKEQEEESEEEEGRQKATKPGFFWQLDPASRRADRFLLFNPMKRLILETNRITGPVVHSTGRGKNTTGSGNNSLFPVTMSRLRIFR